VLDGEDPVHTLEAQAALAIQEVGDVSLLESGLLSQPEPGQIALVDALPKSFAEVVLQYSEFHSWEYSTRLIAIR
jgi:sorbitol-specific phosphotransferase system component IIA